MECWTVRNKISEYLDQAMPAEERHRIRQHLSACRDCARESSGHQRMREVVHSLPRRTPPPDLTLRLRVAASKARAQQGPGRWSKIRDRFELALSHLMRPLALPAVGGFCSAVFLFSSLVPTFMPTFAMAHAVFLWDVPTTLTTQPTVKYMAPIAFGGDAVVDVRIDEQGRIVGYAIVSFTGQNAEQLRRSIQNNLVFTEFWPATAFGVPVAGTVRISYRSPANIDIRG